MGKATAFAPFRDLLVVEFGARIAVGATGGLLAGFGADVLFIEPRPTPGSDKWTRRDLFAAGKRSLSTDATEPESDALFRDNLARADVVLTSSDRDPRGVDELCARLAPGAIRCDVTAFGETGPLAGRSETDLEIQGLTGLIDTTGLPDKPAIPIGIPVTEMIAALYAVTGIGGAVRALDAAGPQRVDVALYDCAFSANGTFLPKVIAGEGNPGRMGNRHPMAVPWNVYRAADGWLLICTASDDQWRRLARAMGGPELAEDPNLASNSHRRARADEVDALVESWTAQRSLAELFDALSAIAIPCGPITPIEDYPREPNLEHRGMVRRLSDPRTGETLHVPACPLPGTVAASSIPAPDHDRAALAVMPSPRTVRSAPEDAAVSDPPLAGIRVVEIGQYTTVPLAARLLSAFGAEVVKVEPPMGAPMRPWTPAQAGQGHFFTYNNTDKLSIALDLGVETERALFHDLVAQADVLIENLKPGALAKRGLGFDVLRAANPGLIYCPVSGFGIDSIYPERPAVDTVVQAMSGLMDLNRCDGMPVKAGISLADYLSGVFAAAAVIASLHDRDATGNGRCLDIAMLDVASWATQTAWNGGVTVPSGQPEILTITKAYQHPQTTARALHRFVPGHGGLDWPLLAVPIRLSKAPIAARWPIGPLDGDRDTILAMLDSARGTAATSDATPTKEAGNVRDSANRTPAARGDLQAQSSRSA